MSESARRHEEKSNMIKETGASMYAAIMNQGALIKTLETQIEQMSKVLQERGFGSLPSSTKINPMDHVKSILTTLEADMTSIRQAGSNDHPPMLAPGNYVQWKSRIKRYIDTKPNHELIHYCLKNSPYELGWIDKEIPISEGSPITITERFQETYKNVSPEIRDQLNAEAEA
nr:hypothetical protein [Tanacetum cinerariifolium]